MCDPQASVPLLIMDDKVSLHRALSSAGPAAAALAPLSFDVSDPAQLAAFRDVRASLC